MGRLPRLTPITVAVGVATSLLVGATVAVLTDVVDFDDNPATTDQLIGTDIAVALPTKSQNCGSRGLDFQDGPFRETIVSDFDLNSGHGLHVDGFRHQNLTGSPGTPRVGGEALGPETVLCVRNLGLRPVDVTFSSIERENIEQGQCGRVERDAGDTTCGPGARGEIDGISFVLPSDNCMGGNPVALGGSRLVSSSSGGLPAGATCTLLVAMQLEVFGDQEYARMETDSLTFDISLTAEPR